MFVKLLLLSVLSLGLYYPVCNGLDASNPKTILEFGPLVLTQYEDVGSQEVIYVPIPAAYLSNFLFEWTSSIVQTGSGVSQSCPNIKAVVLVRKWSIPIPNPYKSSSPSNVWIHDEEMDKREFVISQSTPNKTFVMQFFGRSDGNTDVDYYLSVFLEEAGEENVKLDGVSKTCLYMTKLAVRGFSDVPINTANIDSSDAVDSLNSSLLNSDFQLERDRNGLFNTEYKTEKFGYNITRNSSLRFTWMVEPYSDIGGTLKLRLGVEANENETAPRPTLQGCVHSGQSFSDTYISCSSGNMVNVSTSEKAGDVRYQTWYWPYPKSGLWMLDVGLTCDGEECESIVDDTAYVNIDIIQCIEACHSETYQGECRLYRTDVLMFTACDCKGGWAGIACTDGTNAVPYSKQLLIILLLTLSNIIFLPCGILAVMKGYYSESIVYFFVMFFSTFYHACDEQYSLFLCIMKYDTLQFSDFLGSVSAIWFTLIAVADLPHRLESWFHVAGLMAISIAVSYNRFSIYTTLIPTLCGLIILAFKWGRTCKRTSSCFPPKEVWFFSILPGALSALIGFILFAFVETSSNYFYIHSLWHILMGTAVLFLMPKEKKYSTQQHSPCESEASSLNCYNVNAAMMSETDLSDNSA